MSVLARAIDTVAGDGTTLRGFSWRSDAAPRSTVFYIHGIQSHAGWCQALASGLNARSIDLIGFDRRGSGRSDGPRGHAPNADVILNDYSVALDHARRISRTDSLTILGQSFGGSILAALAARGDVSTEHLVFCAPALGQQAHRLGPEGMTRARSQRGLARTPLTLSDTDYTSDPEALSYMAQDRLMIRDITHSMRATMVELEQRYTAAQSWPIWGQISLAVPQKDRIIRLDVAEAVLREFAPSVEVRTFEAEEHFLEWSAARSSYITWLALKAVEHAG